MVLVNDGPATYLGRSSVVSRKGAPVLPPDEARVRAIADIVNTLIQAVKSGQDVDLNQLKTEVGQQLVLAQHDSLASRLGVHSSPSKLVRRVAYGHHATCSGSTAAAHAVAAATVPVSCDGSSMSRAAV
jgi:hypothetical protein